MPKDRLDISGFRGTALPALDPIDLPPEVAAYSENVDVTSRPGLLQGVEQGNNQNATPNAGWICPAVLDDVAYVYDGTSWHTIDLDTFTDSSFSGQSASFIEGAQSSMGEAARFPVDGGAAKWIGPIRKDLVDGTSRSTSATMKDATLQPPSKSNIVVDPAWRRRESNIDTNLVQGVVEGAHYHFFAAWLFDGYQTSPLTNLDRYIRGRSQPEIPFTVRWTDLSATPDRAEALLIYVAEDRNGQKQAPDDTPRRFVERLDVGDSDVWSANDLYRGLDETSNDAWSRLPLLGKKVDVNEDQADYTESDTASITINASDITTETITEITIVNTITIDIRGDANARGTANLETPEGNTSFQAAGTNLRQEETLTNLTLSGTDTITINFDITASATDGAAVAAVRCEVYVAIDDNNFNTGYMADLSLQGALGQAYSDQTGVSRAAAEDQVKQYKHSVTSGPYHVVAGPTIDDKIGDTYNTGSYVLRSKAYRPDMYDWINDFVQVSGTIQGLASHNDFVICFTEEDTYIIDQTRWAVTERLTNVTAFDDKAWASTPFGLVFCDPNGVYLWQEGESYRVLSEPIEQTPSGTPQYRDTVTGSSFEHLTYDPATRMTVVLYDNGNIEGWGYVMPLPAEKELRAQPYWTHLSASVFGTQSSMGGMIEADGKALACMSGGLIELFGSSSRSSWTWRSKTFGPGGATRKWTPYRLTIIPSGFGGTVKYKEDGGSFSTASADSNQSGVWIVNSYGGTPPWTKVHRLQLQLEGGASDTVKAIGLSYRAMPALTDDA